MGASAELKNLLDGVSRSFAVCIDRLDAPYADWVAIAYLLCRISDTIEDSPWSNPSEQGRAFATWLDALTATNELDSQSVAEGRLRLGLSEAFAGTNVSSKAERDLLLYAPELLARFRALPDAARSPIYEGVRSMTEGMRFFAERSRTRDRASLTLLGPLEINQYCFFVAGLVGEILTRLFAATEPANRGLSERLREAHHFGLFLQKVNLLKDQSLDEGQGRRLVPDRDALMRSLSEHAFHTKNYILSIPASARSFQVFCAWSFGLALVSLGAVEAGFKEGRAGKIPRSQTKRLFDEIDSWTVDQLGEHLCEWIDGLPRTTLAQATLSDDEHGLSSQEIFALYRGQLSQDDLENLGVLPQARRGGVRWTASLSSR